jgi:MOSC domain-containing protein YiiM
VCEPMLRSRCQVEGSPAIATQRVTARSAGPGRGYELTLVEAEVLDEIQLSWEDARCNIVTTGISLNALVGKRFHTGPVECVGRRLAEPCAHLEKLTRPGLLRPLVHRGGLRADILSGGTISIGDEIA